MFKKQNCSRGAKYNKLMRLAATMDLEKNFCTIMPVIAADAYQSRDRPIPLIIIYKGKARVRSDRSNYRSSIVSVVLRYGLARRALSLKGLKTNLLISYHGSHLINMG